MTAIRINGEDRTVASSTIEALLSELKLEGKKVAVELNKKIIRRDTYNETVITDGDSVEIVNFVGGG